MKKLLLASAAVLLATTSANAGSIAIGLELDGTSTAPEIQTFSGGASLNLGNVNVGPYFVQNVSGATQGVLAWPDVLDSNTLVINAAAGTTTPLHIFVTAQGVNVDPNVNPQYVTSSFDNVGLAAGWSVIEQTYDDPNNGPTLGGTGFF